MSEIINSILSGQISDQIVSNQKQKRQLNSSTQETEGKLPVNKNGKNGLWRLNSALANDQPLRDNVPRGYYLNILV